METNEKRKRFKDFWNRAVRFHNKLLLIGVGLLFLDYFALYKTVGESPQLYPYWMWIFFASFTVTVSVVFIIAIILTIFSSLNCLPKKEEGY